MMTYLFSLFIVLVFSYLPTDRATSPAGESMGIGATSSRFLASKRYTTYPRHAMELFDS